MYQYVALDGAGVESMTSADTEPSIVHPDTSYRVGRNSRMTPDLSLNES